jgi:hypothetical protein
MCKELCTTKAHHYYYCHEHLGDTKEGRLLARDSQFSLYLYIGPSHICLSLSMLASSARPHGTLAALALAQFLSSTPCQPRSKEPHSWPSDPGSASHLPLQEVKSVSLDSELLQLHPYHWSLKAASTPALWS